MHACTYQMISFRCFNLASRLVTAQSGQLLELDSDVSVSQDCIALQLQGRFVSSAIYCAASARVIPARLMSADRFSLFDFILSFMQSTCAYLLLSCQTVAFAMTEYDISVVVQFETYPMFLYFMACPITDDPFAEEDCRDILEQAIEWWKQQLAAVETNA